MCAPTCRGVGPFGGLLGVLEAAGPEEANAGEEFLPKSRRALFVLNRRGSRPIVSGDLVVTPTQPELFGHRLALTARVCLLEQLREQNRRCHTE